MLLGKGKLRRCSHLLRMTMELLAIMYECLLPMLMNLMRFASLVFIGKRKVIRSSVLSETKGRNELYQQFKLFEFQ